MEVLQVRYLRYFFNNLAGDLRSHYLLACSEHLHLRRILELCIVLLQIIDCVEREIMDVLNPQQFREKKQLSVGPLLDYVYMELEPSSKSLQFLITQPDLIGTASLVNHNALPEIFCRGGGAKWKIFNIFNVVRITSS